MRKLLHYALNGVINVIATYALYLILVRFVDYRVAIVAVYAVGICLSFFLHGHFVFEAPGHFGLFVAVNLGLMLINMIVTWSLVEGLQWAKEIAQLPAIAVVVIVGFMVNRRYVFAGTKT